MVLTSGENAPYAPPATVIEVITRYRERGLTTPINVEVLERAGIPDSLTRRTLQSLKLLGILDGGGEPTSEFEQATRSPDDEFREKLRDVILGMYSEVLQFADPATDSYDRVRDAFRGFNPRGQQDRMVTLFLGLLDFLAIDTSAAQSSRTRESGAKTNGAPRTVKKVAAKPEAKAKAAKASTSSGTSVASAGSDLPPGLVGLLQQIPRAGAGWPQARRDEFLAAFTAVLNFTVPVRETEPAATAPSAAQTEEDAP